MSKRYFEDKTADFQHWQDKAVTGGCVLVTGLPALRWQEHYTGVYTKREKLPLRCADMPSGKTGIQGILIGAEAQGVAD